MTTEEQKPTTDYVVFAVVGEATITALVDGMPATFLGPKDWPLELWREPLVLSVPQRTTRAAVVERAKEVVGQLVGDETESVRVRVFPLAEMTEAIVEVERTPTLVARIVEPGGGVAAPEEAVPAAEEGAEGAGQGSGPLAALTGGDDAGAGNAPA